MSAVLSTGITTLISSGSGDAPPMEVFSQVRAETPDVVSKHLLELLPGLGGDLRHVLVDDRAGHQLAPSPPQSWVSPATGGHHSLIPRQSAGGGDQGSRPSRLLRRLVILPIKVGILPPIFHTDESKHLLHRLVALRLQVVGHEDEQLFARYVFHVTIDLHGVATGVDILRALLDG